MGLMRDIAGKESISVEDAALTMIARAAEGSARDALSLMDQAIAHSSGTVTAEAVCQMLGLADRGLIIDLFGEIMGGDVAAALGHLKALHDVGADPSVVLEDLAAFTRLKLAPSAEEDAALTEEEKARGAEFAGKLSLRVLARAWQMLLKGIEEAKESSRPLAAADMVIVRLAHAADLPTPDEALKSLAENGASPSSRPRESAPPPSRDDRPRMAMGAGAPRQPAPQPRAELSPAPRAEIVPGPRLETFADLVALAGERRELKLKHALETTVRPVRFEPGQIEIALTEHASAGLAGELSKKLEQWTGSRWMIAVARDGNAPTIAEARKTARDQLVDDARADPLVAAVLQRFPGAEIVDVRVHGGEAEAAPADALPPPPDEETED
jgi:DNA polymerase-3 subunit gamma/tau